MTEKERSKIIVGKIGKSILREDIDSVALENLEKVILTKSKAVQGQLWGILGFSNDTGNREIKLNAMSEIGFVDFGTMVAAAEFLDLSVYDFLDDDFVEKLANEKANKRIDCLVGQLITLCGNKGKAFREVAKRLGVDK